MANVEWVRLQTDMFDNRKIKYIRTLPEGNNIVLIWVMLLTMAGRCNSNGLIFLTENVPYTTHMLAAELGFDETVVAMAISVFERLGMVATSGEALLISSWNEHQFVDGLEKIREKDRNRKREKKKQEQALLDSAENSTEIPRNDDGNSTDSSYIYNSLGFSSSSKDLKDNKDSSSNTNSIYKDIIDYLNITVGTHYSNSSKSTIKHINARLSEGFTIEDFKTVIDKKSDEWIGTQFEQYLKPDTLFGTKFEGYLNQKINPKGTKESKPLTGDEYWDSL